MYDRPEHHHHETGSTGAACVNCHMPVETYMVVDDRHDHGFRIPEPRLTLALGVPNTCNQCHEDKGHGCEDDNGFFAHWVFPFNRTISAAG